MTEYATSSRPWPRLMEPLNQLRLELRNRRKRRAHLLLIYAYEALDAKKWRDARFLARRAHQLDASISHALTVLGHAHLGLQRHLAAIRYFQRAYIKLQSAPQRQNPPFPDLGDAACGLAMCHAHLSRDATIGWHDHDKQSLQWLQIAIHCDPNIAEIATGDATFEHLRAEVQSLIAAAKEPGGST